ncbi:hypothetical protein, partial [Sulfuriflexus sp.]|uniref:hypothetical protein n=1 Tax=Sulfuriflexus sp. TaxID=2015443 RepID=UPI0028CF4BC9
KIDPKFILVTPVTGDVDSIKAGTISSKTIKNVASRIGRTTTGFSIVFAAVDNFSKADQLGGIDGALAYTSSDVAVILSFSAVGGPIGVGGGIAFGAVGGTEGVTRLLTENVIGPLNAGLETTVKALQEPSLFDRLFFPERPDTTGIGR